MPIQKIASLKCTKLIAPAHPTGSNCITPSNLISVSTSNRYSLKIGLGSTCCNSSITATDNLSCYKCSPHLSLSVTKTMPATVQMFPSKTLKMSDADTIKVSWRQSHVRSRDCFIFRKSWALSTSKHCHPRPTVTTKQIVSCAMHRMKIHPRFPLRRGQDSLQAHLCLSMGCFWAYLVNLLISKRWPKMIPFQSALAWD